MYQLTKSPFCVGLLGVAEFGLMFVMGLGGGALADHVNRRLLIVMTEMGLIRCSLALIANSLLARPSVWGVGIIGFSLANHLWLAFFFLALAGVADMISGLFRLTMWNQTIPDYLRGRLAGIEMISYLSEPYLGNAEAGLVASFFGLRASIVSGGVLCGFGAAVLAVLLPAFLRYDSRDGVAHKEAEEAARAQI